MTALAPSASALTASLPRRMPPSSRTSIWSPTAAATAGRARMVAGVPSRLLPPWFDTEMALTPASTARLASSTRVTPLSMNGAAPLLAQPGHVLPTGRRGPHPFAVGAEERRPGLALGHHVRRRSGRGTCPVRAKEAASGVGQRLGAKRSMARRSTVSGMVGLPQSRPWENDQSKVAMRPTAPGGPGPLDARRDLVPAADPVDLEEGLRVGRHHVLDRHAGERAQAHGGAAGGGGPGHGHLAPGVHGLDPGRGDEDREARSPGP